MQWYDIVNIEDIDSPSVVLYEDRLMANIRTMIDMVEGDASRLMPHIKTNKMPEVVRRMRDAGIHQYKASTIAEAEMAAMQGVGGVLIAHQLVGPKVGRFLELIREYPSTEFATLIDNPASLHHLDTLADAQGNTVHIYIDINNGMNRTGVKVGAILDELIVEINKCKRIKFRGLHVYDGHLRDPGYDTRRARIGEDLEQVDAVFKNLKLKRPDLLMVCGGSPSFSSHMEHADRVCSPGTVVFWDWGYGETLREQGFKPAALVVCRVISKPDTGIVTVDLGHKAVASENPISERVRFLNLDGYELLSQSEEHGVLKVSDWDAIHVGDVLYGMPFHVCPTINMYDEVSLVRNGRKTATWEVTARRRKIRI